jgi:hypothetical protein
MADGTDGLTASDLDGEQAEVLPAREVMSLINPSAGASVLPGLGGSDPAGGGTPSTSPTPGAETAGTGTDAAGGAAGDASQFTPPPSEGDYSPSQSSSSTT